MAALRIPEQGRKALRQLASMKDDAFDELRSALAAQRPAIFGDDFVQRTVAGLKATAADEAAGVLRTLLGISLAKLSKNRSTDQLCQDIEASLRKDMKGDTALDDAGIKRALARLTQLLAVPSFEVSAKALGVFGEHQLIYESARVFSDIRPVFGDDVSSDPAAAVVFHNLKIEYVEGTESKELYLALDGEDLDELIGVLSRAKQKEASIQAMLSKQNLPRLREE